MHEVLVNRLGGLSLSRKSVVRSTDRPDCPICGLGERFQPLKRQTKIATDDSLVFIYFYLSKKISLDFPRESSA